MLQKIIDHPLAGDNRLGSLTKILTGGAPVPLRCCGACCTLHPQQPC
jgi:hypothetical protein